MRTMIKIIAKGNKAYYLWAGFLLVCIIQGLHAYSIQASEGLFTTHMRDSVSWGFYIGNFTFLVGVAASAVMLVIPAYVYNWKPIKEVVLFGELLAISAIMMCLLFVIVDIGRPDRAWHMIPLIGQLNFPSSLLAWDALILNAYLGVNAIVVALLLTSIVRGRSDYHRLILWLVLLSIPLALGIHTVTAFLYNGMVSRPYWNSAILAPRFLASAFCSGPAVLLILFQVLRKVTPFEIKNSAIEKIAEIMAYMMGFNLFLLGAEVFKEFYSDTHHLVHYQYLFFGLNGETSPIAIHAWTSLIFSIIAFFLFLVPRTRRNIITMNIGAFLIYFSVYIEKGIALIVPGYTPDTLGQIYKYTPSIGELRVSVGIFGIGFFVFTMLVRIAIYILFERAKVELKSEPLPENPIEA